MGHSFCRGCHVHNNPQRQICLHWWQLLLRQQLGPDPCDCLERRFKCPSEYWLSAFVAAVLVCMQMSFLPALPRSLDLQWWYDELTVSAILEHICWCPPASLLPLYNTHYRYQGTSAHIRLLEIVCP